MGFKEDAMAGQKDKQIPIYKEIENYILDSIREGRFRKGMLIPSEEEFCVMFNTSRMTVRRAIDKLVAGNILYRIKGRGTFVNNYNFEKTMNLSTGWSETMRAQGYRTKTKVLNYCKVEANEYVAKNLGIRSGESVILLERLRYADDEPVLIEKAYLNASRLDGIMDYEFSEESLYHVFREQFHIELNHVYQKLYTKIVTGEYAEMLFQTKSATALVMENTSFDERTTPVEFTICYINGDKYTLRYALNK